MQLLQIQGDLPTQLHRFVTSLLKLIDADETIQVLRVAISVGGTTDIGRRFYELGTHEVWLTIGDVLREEIDKGTLAKADPDMLATNLHCLCEAELIRNIPGAHEPANDQENDHKAQRHVEG